jgi:hypothetical protein
MLISLHLLAQIKFISIRGSSKGLVSAPVGSGIVSGRTNVCLVLRPPGTVANVSV